MACDVPVGMYSDVEKCGICSRWISKAVYTAYRNSMTLEEAKIRAAVISDGSYTDELDNGFCDYEATGPMALYMKNIWLDSGCDERLFKIISAPPVEAVFDGAGENDAVKFRLARSFYLVRRWLEENAPVYEDHMRKRGPNSPLKDLMINFSD